MFSKQVAKINHLLLDQKEEGSSLCDSLPLRTCRTSTHRHHSRLSASTPRPKYQSEITLIKEDVPKKYAAILEDLFTAKCSALSLNFNEDSWEAFIKAFTKKNKFKDGEFPDSTLDLSDFGFSQTCVSQINQFLRKNICLSNIKLSKNNINPNHLAHLQTMKQLFLGNCRLGNDSLELLFTKLHVSCIEKLCLSSPELKNRNTLTKYKALISLIQSSSTLHTLQLSNMDIQPDCLIIESCRNSFLKHLDLSSNTNVKGICPTLLSLNLARNAIVVPFTYPMLPNQLQILNISHNKIPLYQFKQFLRYAYFSNLRQLIVDHTNLNCDLPCFQLFLEQAQTLLHLSMVSCNLSQGGFLHIAHGVKHNQSLEILNLSWNKVLNERVADYISHMLQGCRLKEIRLRHCDISDGMGQVIFRNIRRNKTLQKIDVMNNLLGDRTAKTIRNELKYAKCLTAILLQENTVKYSDIHEIESYLESNKYLNSHQLDKEYQKLQFTNTQIVEANMIISSQAERISKLEKETENLHLQYLTKFKTENQQRKKRLRSDIYSIRDSENQLMMDITLLQALPSLTDLNSMESRRESFISNHQSFNNL